MHLCTENNISNVVYGITFAVRCSQHCAGQQRKVVQWNNTSQQIILG